MNEDIDSILNKTKADVVLANLTGKSITQTTDAIKCVA